MPIAAAVGVEPIPGYRLVERLGFGGYGEVWKVTAPGGLCKAMKLIYGDLSGPRAEQELKAMERIKAVRHPFLLSLERFEILGGQVVIIIELADGSLLDRFKACREASQPGIPRQELLGYLRDAAEALDYMNDTHGLQHLDIKPENLLLVGGRIKVADFGLVKEFAGSSTSITGGVTPVYASPEAFDGRVSRFSDQYSLAIVYQEMLTGIRPFPGTTAFQLAAQHTSAPPMLDPLPAQDRPTIARALSKLPEQRFGSCQEMIDALRAATVGPAPAAPAPRSEQRSHHGPAPHPAAEPATAQRVLEMATLVEGGLLTDVENQLHKGPASTPCLRPLASPGADVERRPRSDAGDPQGLRPMVFLGIGGLAQAVLRGLRGRLHDAWGVAERFPLFQFLLFDTDRGALQQALRGPDGEALAPVEVVHCPLRPTEHYRDAANHLLRWLNRRWLYNIPRSLLTEGLRPLGRLALVDNATAVLAAIRQALLRATSAEARSAAAERTGRGLRTDGARIFLVASITGGTGGGMLADIAYAVRQVADELRLTNVSLSGVLLLACGPQRDERTRARIDAYAALLELNHWAQPGVAFPGTPEYGLLPSGPGRPPFDDCYALYQSEQPGAPSPGELSTAAAEYLFCDAGLAGVCLDRLRLLSRASAGSMTLRSFGLSGVRFPRQALLDSASAVICRQLVERWRGEVNPTQRERLARQIKDRVQEQGLKEEALREQLQERLTSQSGRGITERLGALAETLRGMESPVQPGSALVVRLLSQIEDLLGAGNSDASSEGVQSETGSSLPAPVETACRQQAKQLVSEQGRQLHDWFMERIETPGERLKAAEIAQAELNQHFLDAIERTRTRLAQLKIARREFRMRLMGQEAGKSSGLLHRGLAKLGLDSSKERQLFRYLCLRTEELIEQATLDALAGIHAKVTALGQDFTRARQRLADLLGSFGPREENAPASERRQGSSGPKPALIELFPFEANDLAQAASLLLSKLPADLMRQFDLRFQMEVLDAGGGLWALLTGQVDQERLTQSRMQGSIAFWSMIQRNEGVNQEVRDSVLRRAHDLLGEHLRGVSVTSLLMERYSEGEPFQRAVRDLVRASQPTVGTSGSWEHTVVVIPDDPHAFDLREQLLEPLTGSPVTILQAGESLIVVREAARLSLADLASHLVEDDPGIVELARRLLTRTDVNYSALSGG